MEVERDTGTVAWRLLFDDEADAVYSADHIDGCDLFAETSRCTALAERLDALSPWFE